MPDGEHGAGEDICAVRIQRSRSGFRDSDSDSVWPARHWIGWTAKRLDADRDGYDRRESARATSCDLMVDGVKWSYHEKEIREKKKES